MVCNNSLLAGGTVNDRTPSGCRKDWIDRLPSNCPSNGAFLTPDGFSEVYSCLQSQGTDMLSQYSLKAEEIQKVAAEISLYQKFLDLFLEVALTV